VACQAAGDQLQLLTVMMMTTTCRQLHLQQRSRAAKQEQQQVELAMAAARKQLRRKARVKQAAGQLAAHAAAILRHLRHSQRLQRSRTLQKACHVSWVTTRVIRMLLLLQWTT
jgi:hypothetical protein